MIIISIYVIKLYEIIKKCLTIRKQKRKCFEEVVLSLYIVENIVKREKSYEVF